MQGGSPEALKNLALAKFEAGDETGSLTMLKQQSKDAIFGPVEGVCHEIVWGGRGSDAGPVCARAA